MTKKIGFLIDPIETFQIKKDTSFALMLEAQRQGNQVVYFTMPEVWLENGIAFAHMHFIKVEDNPKQWFTIQKSCIQPLHALDLLLMRKDPPFDIDYVHITYLLEQAEKQGLLVLNKPRSLRDANEKLFTAWFPQCCPDSLVSADSTTLTQFIAKQPEAIIKPLGSMGGDSIYRVTKNTKNLNQILSNMTADGKHMIMSQRYIPEITDGDKRIILINGQSIGYALARIPAEGDFRGNLAAGARGEVRELTKRDQWICDQVGPTLQQKGLYFVGLDVIGDYLTEINVTSPTGIREIERETHTNICEMFFKHLPA